MTTNETKRAPGTWNVELWVVTSSGSEFGGDTQIAAATAQEAVESVEAWDWAEGGDYGDSGRVRVRLIVRGADRAIVAQCERVVTLAEQ